MKLDEKKKVWLVDNSEKYFPMDENFITGIESVQRVIH